MKKNRGSSTADMVIGVALLIFIVGSVFIGFARGCSQQGMARYWGGETDMYIEPNRKLIEMTWKDDNVWLLTRPMTDEDIADVYEFSESDAIGILEGTLHIYETKIDDEKEYKEYLKWKETNEASNYQDYLDYKDQHNISE